VTPPAVVCCCGHRSERHHPDYGFCMDCRSGGCFKFHKVGEGHGYAFEVAVLVLAAILALGSWRFWRLHKAEKNRRAGVAAVQSTLDFFQEESKP
jgi:hypothetical protein